MTKQYLGRGEREQRVRFLAGLRRSLTCLWANYLTLMCIWWTELWNIWSILPFSLCFGFIFSLFSYMIDKFIAGLVFMLVMLVSCEWTSRLYSVGTWWLYYAYLFLFIYDLVPTWLMNVFPSVTKLYNQENLFKKPKP